MTCACEAILSRRDSASMKVGAPHFKHEGNVGCLLLQHFGQERTKEHHKRRRMFYDGYVVYVYYGTRFLVNEVAVSDNIDEALAYFNEAESAQKGRG